MGEKLIMSHRDIDKLHVIRNVVECKLKQDVAATMLGLSVRQIRRLCVRVKAEGARGIQHRLKGRVSNRQLDTELLGKALSAVHDPLWEGFGPTFAQQKLQDWYGVSLSDWTLRRIMTATGLWKTRRRRAQHRAWRQRRPCVGMLIQLDGSPHDWFEGRGAESSLLIYIDDATSRILYGEFIEAETTRTLMHTTRTYLKKWGRPVALYVDKHSIYNVNRNASIEEELRGEQAITQFTRAMGELNIEVILANSPQAKGRVERGFDTHQDRLVKELRLRGISTMEEANRYLRDEYIPEHNERYAVAPADSADAHRLLRTSYDLNAILSIQVDREVQRDFTVQYCNRFFQLSSKQRVRIHPRTKITIRERLDGSIELVRKGRRLDFKNLMEKPVRRRSPKTLGAKNLAARSKPRKRRRFIPNYAALKAVSRTTMNPPASYFRQT